MVEIPQILELAWEAALPGRQAVERNALLRALQLAREPLGALFRVGRAFSRMCRSILSLTRTLLIAGTVAPFLGRGISRPQRGQGRREAAAIGR